MKLGKASRPILQADGTLTQVEGEPIKQWVIKQTPEVARMWQGLYWNAVKKKKDLTFNQLYQQASYLTAVEAGTRQRPAFWKAYHPPRTLPLMPSSANDWHRLVSDVPRKDLH
jgi:hypothetical protein